jgi:hypothetical protein
LQNHASFLPHQTPLNSKVQVQGEERSLQSGWQVSDRGEGALTRDSKVSEHRLGGEPPMHARLRGDRRGRSAKGRGTEKSTGGSQEKKILGGGCLCKWGVQREMCSGEQCQDRRSDRDREGRSARGTDPAKCRQGRASHLGGPLRGILHHRLAEAVIHVGRHLPSRAGPGPLRTVVGLLGPGAAASALRSPPAGGQ